MNGSKNSRQKEEEMAETVFEIAVLVTLMWLWKNIVGGIGAV